jgi:predicted O-methyltransferase YrrM
MTAASLFDPELSSLLDRLHTRAARQERGLFLRFLDQLPRLVTGRELNWNKLGKRLDDAWICIDRDQGAFLYLLARALGAKHIVEFGTSFGVSTIYLAAAVRDNGGGIVIGTEQVPSKAERAKKHLTEAGLDAFVDVRVGDARETLRSLDLSVDLLLCDGFPPATLDVLKLVQPRFHEGSVVFSDNTGTFARDHEDYLAYLRDPVNGYVSSELRLNEGSEMSVYSGHGRGIKD